MPHKLMKFTNPLPYIIYKLSMNDKHKFKNTVVQLHTFKFFIISIIMVRISFSGTYL